jgi:hypothetical protein
MMSPWWAELICDLEVLPVVRLSNVVATAVAPRRSMIDVADFTFHDLPPGTACVGVVIRTHWTPPIYIPFAEVAIIGEHENWLTCAVPARGLIEVVLDEPDVAEVRHT